MKTSKFALAFLTCATSSVFAQDSPQCEVTNFDQSRGIFTVINPAPGALNQQCFITVHPASAPAGRFVEGQYEILLSGGGGGGGGGASEPKAKPATGGQGGAGALPARTTRYLSPGVYRLTMGTGGLGGGAAVAPENPGGNAGHGNPTGVAEAYSGQTIAGFPRAEMWAGHSAESYMVATGSRGGRAGMAGPSSAVHDGSGPGAVNGPNGSSREGPAQSGDQGGHGFIKMTLVAQAAAPAVTPAPVIIERAPAPAPVLRPIKKDRN